MKEITRACRIQPTRRRCEIMRKHLKLRFFSAGTVRVRRCGDRRGRWSLPLLVEHLDEDLMLLFFSAGIVRVRRCSDHHSDDPAQLPLPVEHLDRDLRTRCQRGEGRGRYRRKGEEEA